MGLLRNTIYARKALVAYVISGFGLAEKLRAIRPTHRSKLRRSKEACPGLATRYAVPTHQNSARNSAATQPSRHRAGQPPQAVLNLIAFAIKSLCENSLSSITEPLRPLFSDGSKPA
jgi:hypothetical protein